MRFGQDFWAALHALAIHVEHLPGGTSQRRRLLLNALAGFGPIGRMTALEELELVVVELAALRCEILKAEAGASAGAEGHPGDGQFQVADPGRQESSS